MGTDGDGSLQLTEFIAAASDKKKLLAPGAAGETFSRLAERGFRVFDVDGDGQITKAELLAFFGGSLRTTKGQMSVEAFLKDAGMKSTETLTLEEFKTLL